MRDIVSFFPEETLVEAVSLFSKKDNIVFSGSGNSSSKAMVLSQILKRAKGENNNVFWVVSDHNELNKVQKAISVWSDKNVYIYKKREAEEIINFPNGAEFERTKRLEVLKFISSFLLEKDSIFVLNFESILQKLPNPKEILKKESVLKTKDEIDVVGFIEKLVSLGYENTDEDILNEGYYYRKGDSIFINPINTTEVYRVDINFDKIEGIYTVNKEDHSKEEKKENKLRIFPAEYDEEVEGILEILKETDIIVDDEVDVVDDYYDIWNSFMESVSGKCKSISFSTFNDDVSNHQHLHHMSVLKYRTAYDFANDIRDKIKAGYKNIVFTKRLSETKGLFNDQAIPFKVGIDKDKFRSSSVFIIEVDKEDIFPQSFQAPKLKINIVNDTDLSFIKEEKKTASKRTIFDDFLTSLKAGDYVVHADHGIARFLGLDQKTIDAVTKEYLKLGYAENDKLFVPIDQADKVNKYIGSEELRPKLTRLGSAEWNTITSKVQKETQQIAKELLKLYAERKAAKGVKFKTDNDLQEKFEKTFPYEETPGQIKAINDVKSDMESGITMDRLICGDVGFGKTEVAMRATFKAVQSGKQVAVVSPITILADQHYRSFKKRMEDFDVRVEMLSRFRTGKQQKEIVEKLKKGELDVIVGTHRLMQPDIKFKNLGLVVIDEEQRFGVKQKEKLKEMRKEVDILTLTATPIPRTLNICLNKLRDITTITTPPPGRLPVVTEVRKYSPNLVREAILREVERGGQVYFLHNRVQTIDGFTEKLKELVPEARFGVAHGKLGSGDLEERIVAFKEYKYDVLVSSTIIENGIDLANANTLIVNNAEKFGLSQLYQLRGRVGRGKRQAYAYFLYHGQRLKLDAKKRLRAIVEASDLGSGFQIAMKDLEIRGAGDILGANQHGVINVVGMAHFMRMLNKAVEDLKMGRVIEGEEVVENVSVELPIPAYIPDNYISDSKEKIGTYQKLSSADSNDYLKEIRDELIDAFGKMPREVDNLFKIIQLKMIAKDAGLMNIKSETVPMSKDKEIVLHMSGAVKPANIVNLLEYNPNWRIIGSRLRINKKLLTENWFKELNNCVKKLSKKAEHGAKKKKKD